jgi:hypothetical protein
MHYEKSQAKATNYVSTDQITQTKKYDGISVLPPFTSVAQAKTVMEDPGRHPTPVQKQANHTGMPDNLKTGVENLSGFSMDAVRVHYNSEKPAQLQALAYTQGTDIHVAPGQERHVPHEAWHVAQQMQGRVQPTFQMKEAGVAVNDDPALEREADEMGANADHYSDFNALGQDIVKSRHPQGVVQRELGTVVAVAGLGLSALGIIPSFVKVTGELSYDSDQITYPKDLPRVAKTKSMERTVASFRSYGLFSNNKTDFKLYGEFSSDPESPIMANVYFSLDNTTEYSYSALSFSAKALATPYGTPEDPRIRFVCTGRFDPAGKGDCRYRVVIEINKYGHATCIEQKITAGKGDLHVYKCLGFQLFV